MHFTNPLTLLLLLTPFATATPTTDTSSLDLLEAFVDPEQSVVNVTKRACDYNGCKCKSRGKQLTVCGNCVWRSDGAYVVTTKRKPHDIFECSPSGDCCSYGYATDCGGSGARCIVN
ncbi:hypothetical protein B0T25DRAFT_170466 [Lasiosphaeria hispida]|uniref:Mold-specific m46 protein n=1 Tax=Lasiosphaeria hispida TaxID=260671 RepID=A0AAJ0HN62_9PEZI|nr:hypothetical protein B0T25DRAFT_170466 [Lasiosphaeria hispida]